MEKIITGSRFNFLGGIKYPALMMFGFGLILLNIRRSIHCGQNIGCIDTYWASFWLISYYDGYKRRAFLGYIAQSLGVENINYLTLNIIAFTFAIFILLVMFFCIWSLAIRNKTKYLIILVLFSGPSATVLFEVLGDPLQVAFVFVLLYFFVATVIKGLASLALAFVIGILIILIHEASTFIFIPAIIIGYSITNSKKIHVPMLLGVPFVIAALFLLGLSDQKWSVPSMALTTINGDLFKPQGNVLPSFFQLLKDEFKVYFTSFDGILYFFSSILGSFIWPILFTLVISRVIHKSSLIKVYILLLVASSPLYIIAHDWGRFSIYSLLLSILIVSFDYSKNNIAQLSFANSLSYKLKLFSYRYLDIKMLYIFPILYYAHANYRINGLETYNLLLVCFFLMLFSTYSKNTGAHTKSE